MALARAEHLLHALSSPCSIGSAIVCEASRFVQTERLSCAANLGDRKTPPLIDTGRGGSGLRRQQEPRYGELPRAGLFALKRVSEQLNVRVSELRLLTRSGGFAA